jgi:hypothetical protein
VLDSSPHGGKGVAQVADDALQVLQVHGGRHVSTGGGSWCCGVVMGSGDVHGAVGKEGVHSGRRGGRAGGVERPREGKRVWMWAVDVGGENLNVQSRKPMQFKFVPTARIRPTSFFSAGGYRNSIAVPLPMATFVPTFEQCQFGLPFQCVGGDMPGTQCLFADDTPQIAMPFVPVPAWKRVRPLPQFVATSESSGSGSFGSGSFGSAGSSGSIGLGLTQPACGKAMSSPGCNGSF